MKSVGGMMLKKLIAIVTMTSFKMADLSRNRPRTQNKIAFKVKFDNTKRNSSKNHYKVKVKI